MSAEDTRQNKIEETNKVLFVPNSRRVSQHVLLVKGNGTEGKKKKKLSASDIQVVNKAEVQFVE